MADKITTHDVDAVARLTQKRKSGANNLILLGAITEQVQACEDAWYQLHTELELGNAIGEQLDVIGKIVGQVRNGASDADYERRLRARIATNNSEGLISDIYRVCRGVLNDSTLTLRTSKAFPAGIILRVESGELLQSTADIAILFLRDTVSGGVNLQLHYLPEADSDCFTLCDVTEWPIVVSTSLSVSIGGTTVTADSDVSHWPSIGLISIGSGAGLEVVEYTSISGSAFTVLPLAKAHGLVEPIYFHGLLDADQGCDDATTPTSGGYLAGVIE